MRETFLWIGDDFRQCADDLDLIGKPYKDEHREGIVVETTALTITIEFPDPPSLWQRIKAWFKKDHND